MGKVLVLAGEIQGEPRFQFNQLNRGITPTCPVYTKILQHKSNHGAKPHTLPSVDKAVELSGLSGGSDRFLRGPDPGSQPWY